LITFHNENDENHYSILFGRPIFFYIQPFPPGAKG